MCHRPNSRMPGESIRWPPWGKCNKRAFVVVWLPVFRSERAPTRRLMPGSNALASDDLPTPDCPTNALVYWRSEEHTSELQSRGHLVCRLLLEKKKTSV